MTTSAKLTKGLIMGTGADEDTGASADEDTNVYEDASADEDTDEDASADEDTEEDADEDTEEDADEDTDEDASADEGKCSICLENESDFKSIQLVTNWEGYLPEGFEQQGCPHSYCRECLTRYLKEGVENGHKRLECPGCSCHIHPNTVKKLCGEKCYKVLIASQNFAEKTEELREMATKVPEMEQYLNERTQVCPGCTQTIERPLIYGGCDEMYCITCGTSFCFKCGVDLSTIYNVDQERAICDNCEKGVFY